jgi:hypothetical protein
MEETKDATESPTNTPEEEITSLLHRPTAGFEIPDHLRQPLLQMVRDGKIREAGSRQGPYDLAIFWRVNP